jgi:hypothetical protein
MQGLDTDPLRSHVEDGVEVEEEGVGSDGFSLAPHVQRRPPTLHSSAHHSTQASVSQGEDMVAGFRSNKSASSTQVAASARSDRRAARTQKGSGNESEKDEGGGAGREEESMPAMAIDFKQLLEEEKRRTAGMGLLKDASTTARDDPQRVAGAPARRIHGRHASISRQSAPLPASDMACALRVRRLRKLSRLDKYAARSDTPSRRITPTTTAACPSNLSLTSSLPSNLSLTSSLSAPPPLTSAKTSFGSNAIKIPDRTPKNGIRVGAVSSELNHKAEVHRSVAADQSSAKMTAKEEEVAEDENVASTEQECAAISVPCDDRDGQQVVDDETQVKHDFQDEGDEEGGKQGDQAGRQAGRQARKHAGKHASFTPRTSKGKGLRRRINVNKGLPKRMWATVLHQGQCKYADPVNGQCKRKQPLFGHAREGQAIYCKAHARALSKGEDRLDGEGPEMQEVHELQELGPIQDVKSPRCLFLGCQKHPIFGDARMQLAIYCAEHRYPHHIDCMNRLCSHMEGCTRQASFGLPASKRPLFCLRHKLASHINVRSPRCIFTNTTSRERCTRQRSFGPRGSPPVYCRAHANMTIHVNVVSPSCRHVLGCDKVPSFGSAADGQILFCAQHSAPHHINLREHRMSAGSLRKRELARKCRSDDACTVRAIFGDPNHPDHGLRAVPIACAAHKEPHYVDLYNPLCQHSEDGTAHRRCTRRATYGPPPSLPLVAGAMGGRDVHDSERGKGQGQQGQNTSAQSTAELEHGEGHDRDRRDDQPDGRSRGTRGRRERDAATSGPTVTEAVGSSSQARGPLFCSNHRKDGHVDLINKRRCRVNNCRHIASHVHPPNKIPTLCLLHKV